jgi:Fe2+ or Zn2+ uptake regulation protein
MAPARSRASFADRAEAALRARKGRITAARRALLELIGSARRPLEPRELQAALAARGLKLDRVSVYRNVLALLELGLVHRVLGSSAVRPCAEHELDQAARCHHAVVCTSCGAAGEFHSEAVERALREVRRATGFLVQGHLLELRGLCPRCARAP